MSGAEVYRNNQMQQLLEFEVGHDLAWQWRYTSIPTVTDARASSVVGPYTQLLNLPALPVIHPYSPGELSAEQQAYDNGIAKFPVVAQVELCNPELLAGLKGVNTVNNYLVVQTNPWQNVPLLFRPHPLVHPDAPEFTPPGLGYNANRNLEVTLFYDDGVIIELGSQGINTHTDGSFYRRPTVFSPNSMALRPEYCNPAVTRSLHSLCIDRANSSATFTLHILLDQNLAQEIAMEEFTTLGAVDNFLRSSLIPSIFRPIEPSTQAVWQNLEMCMQGATPVKVTIEPPTGNRRRRGLLLS